MGAHAGYCAIEPGANQSEAKSISPVVIQTTRAPGLGNGRYTWRTVAFGRDNAAIYVRDSGRLVLSAQEESCSCLMTDTECAVVSTASPIAMRRVPHSSRCRRRNRTVCVVFDSAMR